MGSVTDWEQVALGAPPADLAGFPRWRLHQGQRVYRAHRRDRSPWWFCSDMRCRFDLRGPAGTCYVATAAVTAVRERLGARLVQAGVFPVAEADGFVVSALEYPHEAMVADTNHDAAVSYGLTRELSVVVPYDLPQQWAAAFHAHGLNGVRYAARFTTTPRPDSIAVFAAAGQPDWTTDPEPTPGRIAATAAGITIIDPPRRAALRLTTPPRGADTTTGDSRNSTTHLTDDGEIDELRYPSRPCERSSSVQAAAGPPPWPEHVST